MSNRIYATFGFDGPEVDPEQITAATGITPSRSWRSGDRMFHGKDVYYRRSGWEVKSTSTNPFDIGEHIQSVLDQLKPAWDVVCDLGKTYEPVIACVAYMHTGESTPSVHFDVGVLRKVIELNASIVLDLYCWPSDNDGAPKVL